MKNSRNIRCTLDEVDLIKSYLIKYYHISTSKLFVYDDIQYRMLSIRTFKPSELKKLHKQVKLILKQ